MYERIYSLSEIRAYRQIFDCACGGVYAEDSLEKHKTADMHRRFFNKPLVNRKKKQKTTCECGCVVYNIGAHRESLKHLLKIEEQQKQRRQNRLKVN